MRNCKSCRPAVHSRSSSSLINTKKKKIKLLIRDLALSPQITPCGFSFNESVRQAKAILESWHC